MSERPADLAPPTEPLPVSDDVFLSDGGALRMLQPRAGYRAGMDAVLLAASVTATDRALTVLDAGAGVGVVGLCAARRLATADVTLVEREAALADLAGRNIARNGLDGRVRVVQADIVAKAQALRDAGLPEETFDVVLANPPFHVTGRGTSSGAPLKAASHEMAGADLEAWVRFAVRMARPGGAFTMINKADALGDILAAMAQRFGAIAVKPIQPRAGEAAIRVLVRGIKGSRAPLEIRPPLILHANHGGFTTEVDAVLRKGLPLAL